jgi:hypothetical protein
MNKKTEAMLKSYARGVITAVIPLLTIRNTDLWAYVAAVVAGVIAPAIRAMDKNDPAFGVIAEAAVEATKSKIKK